MQIYNGEQILHLTASVEQNLIRITIVNLSRERIPRINISVIMQTQVTITPSLLQVELGEGAIVKECMFVDQLESPTAVVLQAQWMDTENDIRLVTYPLTLSVCTFLDGMTTSVWQAILKDMPRTEISIGQWTHLSPQDCIDALGRSLNTTFIPVTDLDHCRFASVNPVILLDYQFPRIIIWTTAIPPHQLSWKQCIDHALNQKNPSQAQVFFSIGQLATTISDLLLLEQDAQHIQSKYNLLRTRVYTAQQMELPLLTLSDPLSSQDRMKLTQILSQLEVSISPMG